MLPTPQPQGSVAVPIPSVAPKVFHNKQSKDANNKQGINSILHQPHPTNNCVLLSGSEKSGGVKGGMQEKITNFQKGEPKRGGSSNMDDSRIELRAPTTTAHQAPMIQGSINNKINMTTQNDTQNLSPILIEDIDPDAEDSYIMSLWRGLNWFTVMMRVR
ncbi:hypothetical protein KY290_001032 [Solanum tuberosum]|uniref:Uncharacterized protein n=1 Tax=Solanum tuberosum TaxID=4113 RepID=A0ABQ7WL07_SOLTU|nr:hypothetical protein KY290_001032 [Solanum tuberosum]